MIAPTRWIALSLLLVAVSLPAMPMAGDAQEILAVGNFSAARTESRLPPGWEPLTFQNKKRHTEYRLVEIDGRVVVKAESRDSASGLVCKIRIDPKEFPILKWEWKVARILEKGNGYQKEGDDYAARLYVTFEYDPEKIGFLEKLKYEGARIFYGAYPPLCAISYVWGNRAPKGAVIPNPFSDRAMMIVVESGRSRVDQWIGNTRNIYEDYKAVFGEDPPVISGVAIMTDSDNTGESATAYYGDIFFQKPPGSIPE